MKYFCVLSVIYAARVFYEFKESYILKVPAGVMGYPASSTVATAGMVLQVTDKGLLPINITFTPHLNHISPHIMWDDVGLMWT